MKEDLIIDVELSDLLNTIFGISPATVNSYKPNKPNTTTTGVSQMKNKFIIISSNTNGFSMSRAPFVHNDLSAARTEAERLAKLNPGTTFHVMQFSGSVTASGVQWN